MIKKEFKELLILELKSTSNAHNAGDKYESMIAQVKRYAHLFYQDPTKVLNWHVDPKMILYSGIVPHAKSDIYKELNSNNVSGTHNKIPYLESSYFFNEKLLGSNNTSTPEFNEIRIELYSYEDIYTLSSNRNRVFFRFLARDKFCRVDHKLALKNPDGGSNKSLDQSPWNCRFRPNFVLIVGVRLVIRRRSSTLC